MKDLEKAIAKILIVLIIASVCSGAYAVVRSYTNEVRIEGIKEIVLRIEKKLDMECE